MGAQNAHNRSHQSADCNNMRSWLGVTNARKVLGMLATNDSANNSGSRFSLAHSSKSSALRCSHGSTSCNMGSASVAPAGGPVGGDDGGGEPGAVEEAKEAPEPE